MRTRLILSFTLVVLVSIASMVLVMRQSAAGEVRLFLYGGSANLDQIKSELESYYAANGSWQGVVLPSGKGRSSGQGTGALGGQRLRLYDPDGKLVAVSNTSDQAPASLSANELAQGTRLTANAQTIGYLINAGGAGAANGQESQLIRRLNNAALSSGAIAGGVALALAFFLAYGLLRPINDLRRAALAFGSGDLAVRVPNRGYSELATLARAFNQMAEALQKAEASRRAITADIAHELRTPLAVQRANLEAMQDGVYPLTSESLQSVIEQNHLLTHLVEDLRTLALADAGQLTLDCLPTDYPALIQSIVEDFTPQCTPHGINLTFTVVPPIPTLLIDSRRVTQILHNLLSNALRHTPDNGQIELRMVSSGEQVELTVHDSGAGIPDEALPHVFERFYRADASRSRAAGGSGLGLAIARQLAEAHPCAAHEGATHKGAAHEYTDQSSTPQGSLDAANHPAGGAIFTLRLPVRQQALWPGEIAQE